MPRSTNNRASKGVFGERIFLETRHTTLARHHYVAAHVLSAFSLVGAIIWLYGLATLDIRATVAGIVGVVLPKAWFVDRMVWIFEEMKDSDPRYAGWMTE